MPGPGPEFPERKKAEGPQPEAEAEAGGGRREAGGGRRPFPAVGCGPGSPGAFPGVELPEARFHFWGWEPSGGRSLGSSELLVAAPGRGHARSR